ncbi:uracil-DNA glycosylase family protein [Vaginisenegalia massiliensis]|uniref:uracil-DNA glycosylase family protein n=1 Tax=Vaginisenegalia massiliensis TaxID=2058294 RepID=UPI000F5211B4|nr:uracil-DNA glycosylase family protein [Vaginisenegalia massiliensis]
MTEFERLKAQIMADEANQDYTRQGYEPLFVAPSQARIMIVGQAPGIAAQVSNKAWNDRSGDLLRQWLGIDESTFYDSGLLAHVPMDYYYPGKGKSGDLPPRKDFAAKWHPATLALMPQLQMTILVGQYAQKYYLSKDRQVNLTETVRHYCDYLPRYFPLVHPSPLNIRWQKKNPWFLAEVVPVLQEVVGQILR